MSSNIIKIVTRSSPLALWQAEHCSKMIKTHFRDIDTKIIKITTQGDIWLDVSLAKLEGKGMFVSALEKMLVEKEADIAVHSLKDMPAELENGLVIGAILTRENPLDSFVSNKYKSFDELPKNGIIGTSSLRRSSQLLHSRPDINIKLLRGNVNTRLRKLNEGLYDAIILAHAGLKRLCLSEYICHDIKEDISLPAAGQGVLAIECRNDDEDTKKILTKLHDHSTNICIVAERALVINLKGGCHAPVAAFAYMLDPDTIELRARVMSYNGKQLIEEKLQSKLSDQNIDPNHKIKNIISQINIAYNLGKNISEKLLQRGAKKLIDESINFIKSNQN